MKIKKNMLKVVTLVLFFSFIGWYLALFKVIVFSFKLYYLFAVLFVINFLAWAGLAYRVISFKKKLAIFVREVTENEYRSRIKESTLFGDELTRLESQINKMAAVLERYDQLQQDRIFVLKRIADITYHRISEGIMIFDKQLKVFRLNPRVLALFEVEQENILYDAIVKQDSNREFIGLVKETVDNGKTIENEIVSLELPIRQSKRRISVTMIPVKNKDERVESTIIFVSKAE
jgi:hypothetical protein